MWRLWNEWPPFDIDLRIATAFIYIGKEYASIKLFSMFMNINLFTQSVFDVCVKSLACIGLFYFLTAWRNSFAKMMLFRKLPLFSVFNFNRFTKKSLLKVYLWILRKNHLFIVHEKKCFGKRKAFDLTLVFNVQSMLCKFDLNPSSTYLNILIIGFKFTLLWKTHFKFQIYTTISFIALQLLYNIFKTIHWTNLKFSQNIFVILYF